MLLKYLYIGSLGLSSLAGVTCVVLVQPVLQSPTDVDDATSEYVTGVGMDLTSNYGPPYTNFPDASKDAARQAERRRRKSQGLPASPDVGVLAEMLSVLRHEAEKYLNRDVKSALAATPNLVALYREDVEDAFEYLKLKSLDSPHQYKQLFREPAAAYAANGLGLCKSPFDPPACIDELRKMPYENVLTVSYTRKALCVEVSELWTAYTYTPYPTSPTSMDFSLGSDARDDNPDEWHYWQAVRERIISALAVNWPRTKPTKSFLIGESTQDLMFRIILEDTVAGVLGYVPEVYPEHEYFGAARGAAVLARRGGYFANSSEAPQFADFIMSNRLSIFS